MSNAWSVKIAGGCPGCGRRIVQFRASQSAAATKSPRHKHLAVASPTPYEWEHRQDMRPGSQRSVVTSVVGDQRRLHSINLKTDDLRTNVGRSQDDEAARCLRRFRGRKRSVTSSRDISAGKGKRGDGKGRDGQPQIAAIHMETRFKHVAFSLGRLTSQSPCVASGFNG